MNTVKHPAHAINMTTKAPIFTTKLFSCVAALAACAVVSGPVEAKDKIVTVKVSVSTAGLDLDQPDAAREVYRRLQKAAGFLCGPGGRVDQQPIGDYVYCYEQALGNAVRSANRPQLTMVYLRTHTLQEAATRSINIPVLVAAK